MNLSRYDGEIGFFDFYIIPLARKLKECGVFGVSSGASLVVIALFQHDPLTSEC
jgi:hypothetical protein